MKSPFSGIPDRVRPTRPETIALGLSLLIAGVLGFVLADQILSPSKRVIEALMGVAVLAAAFMLPSRYSVAFMLFIIPFPQYTTMGSTTVIFSFIIFSFWLLRVALGYERRPIGAGIEKPLVLLMLLFILSFTQVAPGHMDEAIKRFRILVSAIFIFYLVLNLVRTERDIRFVLNALIASFFFVTMVAVTEIWLPGYAHIFSILRVKTYQLDTMHGVRVGSVFGDYEMFAEYLAIFIPILLIRILNERVFLKQVIWVPTLMLAIMLLLATATRGAFLALVAGVIYLVWIARRILNYQKLLPILIGVLVVFYVSSMALNQYTRTASLFGRLGETKLVRGMPETRARVWSETWDKIKEKPWLGHGPYFFVGVDERNVRHWYPHSLFLFFSYLVGIPGAILFYYILSIALIRSIRAARAYSHKRTDLAYTVVLLSSVMVIFLVDEMKISFMRYENTQQFTWTMLALLLGSSRIALLLAEKEKKEKGENALSDR